MNNATAEFTYKMPRGIRGVRPGAHRSTQRGSGMNFAAHARMFDQPDPRRLDLRASISSVPRQWLVRTHLQRSSVSVTAIVDVSATMHFGNPESKIEVAGDFVQALGYSAYRFGDAVQLMGYDSHFRDDMHLPPTRARGAGVTMSTSVRNTGISQQGENRLTGLAQCIERVAGKAGLVFLVSDFHVDLARMETVLDELDGTVLIPIVIWHRSEVHPPEQTGLLSVRDTTTGHRRHLWMRDSTREQWRHNVAERRAALLALFGRRDIHPFHIDQSFSADALTQYFMEHFA